MKYTAYVLCEPGMDRPCFSHTPPTPEQQQRLGSLGGKIFSLELELPDFVLVDGALKHTLTRTF